MALDKQRAANYPTLQNGFTYMNRVRDLQVYDESKPELRETNRSFSRIGHHAADNHWYIEASRDLAGRAICRTHCRGCGWRQPLGTPGRCRKRHANCGPVAERFSLGYIRPGRQFYLLPRSRERQGRAGTVSRAGSGRTDRKSRERYRASNIFARRYESRVHENGSGREPTDRR